MVHIKKILKKKDNFTEKEELGKRQCLSSYRSWWTHGLDFDKMKLFSSHDLYLILLKS